MRDALLYYCPVSEMPHFTTDHLLRYNRAILRLNHAASHESGSEHREEDRAVLLTLLQVDTTDFTTDPRRVACV